MTGLKGVVRDERTIAVEEASYRFAYGFLTFALLLDVMYRGLARGEAAWDLLALVIAGGAISTLYQWRQKILTRHSLVLAVVSSVVAAILAAIMAGLLASLRLMR
jgi:hypothetical protein